MTVEDIIHASIARDLNEFVDWLQSGKRPAPVCTLLCDLYILIAAGGNEDDVDAHVSEWIRKQKLQNFQFDPKVAL